VCNLSLSVSLSLTQIMEEYIRYWATRTVAQAERQGRGISEYIDYADLHAYVRITKRYKDGEFVQTMEIANVQVENTRQGTFTKWLQAWEKVAREFGRVVRIESVHNEHLRAFLERRGYIPDPNDPDSFYQPSHIFL
jgi:hypothetical protein